MAHDFINIDTFTMEYCQQMEKFWHDFQCGHIPDKVRNDILDSWKNCKKLNVSPKMLYHSSLSAREFKQERDNSQLLINSASPTLDRIHADAPHNCKLVLLNARNVILKTWGCNGGKLDPKPGMVITERSVGSASSALCIDKQRDIIVYGSEHYCRQLHDMVCISSPVHDSSGRLLGVISIACIINVFHPWSFTLLKEAARSISRQIKLDETSHLANIFLVSAPDPTLIIDCQANILVMNEMAATILNLEQSDLPQPIKKYFPYLKWDMYIRDSSQFCDKKASMITGSDREDYLISFYPAMSGALVILKSIHKSKPVNNSDSTACFAFSDIKGKTQILEEVMSKAKKYAASDLPVLIYGESGTGKELFAQSIHNASRRNREPFIVVNCGALPRGLVQAELFGYDEGAFTGARQKGNPGKFELANGGTIFLDEIGEMDIDAQTSLLRLLQNGEFTRIGGKTSRHVDVRVIAATNRDLQKAIGERKFREDLFHRLNVLVLHIPPLRSRREDIEILAHFFLAKLARTHPQFKNYQISESAMHLLQHRRWPGNVRELEHAIERLAFNAPTTIITEQDVTQDSVDSVFEPEAEQLADRERLIALLEKYNGDVAQVARMCGISKSSLYNKLNVYQIVPKQFRKIIVKTDKSS